MYNPMRTTKPCPACCYGFEDLDEALLAAASPGSYEEARRADAYLTRPEACDTCHGNRSVYVVTISDMSRNMTYRVGDLLLFRGKDGEVQGRYDSWAKETWQHVSNDDGLRSMIRSSRPKC